MGALLDSMIDQVEAKFPAVRYKDGRSRAEEAAEFLNRQAVECLGYQGGRDYWRVGERTCSIKGGCTCPDSQAPLDPNGRKLCKHRLAAMFAYKLRQTHGIARILQDAPADSVTLTVQVLYADHGRQYTLAGWRYPGHEPTTLNYAERVRFTENEFMDALQEAGWGMPDCPVRGNALTYRYILQRGAAIAWSAGAMAAQDVDTRTQRQRMREIAVAADMHAELAAEEAA